MRFNYKSLLFLVFIFVQTSAQVGVGTTTPAAAFDVTSTDGGILVPRVALTSKLIAAPVLNPQGGALVAGTLIWNTATAGIVPNNVVPGFYYWDGSAWTSFGASTNNWALTGNSGTTGANYIGTSDATALKIATSGTEKARVLTTGQFVINNTGTPFADDQFSVYSTIDAVNGYTTGAGRAAAFFQSTGSAGYGAYTVDNSTLGIGTFGTSGGNTGTGIFGDASGTLGVGVWGQTSGTSAAGIFGYSVGSGSDGVYGEATTAIDNGVWGVNNNALGTGVSGTSTGSSGYGVYGVTSGTNGISIYGTATGSAGTGVLGEASQSGRPGVYGRNNNGTGIGTYGTSSGASGFGVYGNSSGNSGIGAYGRSTGSTGFGIEGYNTNAGGTGVVGAGNNVPTFYSPPGGGGAGFTGTLYGSLNTATNVANGVGIAAGGNGITTVTTIAGGAGGAFSGNRFGVQSVATITGAGNNATDRAAYFGQYISGGTTVDNVYLGARIGGVNYKILGTGGGSVSTTMETASGERILFAPEAPENWFFDIGEVELVNGKAKVNLDPLFIDCISDSKPFKVFVQGGENTQGSIRITRDQSDKSFIVEDLGGPSNGTVQYSIYAIWKNKSGLRFPQYQKPEAFQTSATKYDYQDVAPAENAQPAREMKAQIKTKQTSQRKPKKPQKDLEAK